MLGPTASPGYHGYVDNAAQTYIEGWATGADEMGAPVVISINGAGAIEVLPSIPRPDVAAVVGCDVLSGFRYAYPQPLAFEDVVTVCFPDGSPLGGSPTTLHRRRWLELLDGIDVATPGVEIGPLDKPMLEKARARVWYADHASRADLIAKYRSAIETHVVNADTIPDIDIVWSGGPLRSLVEEIRPQWCVASHVIEHTPDMIGWLQSVAGALPVGGLLNLAIPDQRRTFDWRRKLTTLDALVGAYIEKRERPTAAQIFDHCAFAAPLGSDQPVDLVAALALARHAGQSGEYVDVHCQVFTPQSFLETMAEVARMGLSDFSLRRFFATHDGSHEFIASLAKSDAGADERAASYRDAIVDGGVR